MKIAAIVATFMLAVEPVVARYCGEGWIECNCELPFVPSHTTSNTFQITGGFVIPAVLVVVSTAAGVQMSMAEREHYLGQSASSILVLGEVAPTLDALGLVTMLLLVAILVTVGAFEEL